jgi:hypothetical protein
MKPALGLALGRAAVTNSRASFSVHFCTMHLKGELLIHKVMTVNWQWRIHLGF